jgi:hypothetical protein
MAADDEDVGIGEIVDELKPMTIARLQTRSRC